MANSRPEIDNILYVGARSGGRGSVRVEHGVERYLTCYLRNAQRGAWTMSMAWSWTLVRPCPNNPVGTSTLGSGSNWRKMERELWPGLDRWVSASETTNRGVSSHNRSPTLLPYTASQRRTK